MGNVVAGVLGRMVRRTSRSWNERMAWTTHLLPGGDASLAWTLHIAAEMCTLAIDARRRHMSLGFPACTSRRDDVAKGRRLRWEGRQHFERHVVERRLRQKAVGRSDGANGRRGRGDIMRRVLGERGRRARRQGWSRWRRMRGSTERFRVVDGAGRRLRMGLRRRLRCRHGWRGIEGVARCGLR